MSRNWIGALWYQALSLGGVGLLAGGILALANSATGSEIKAAEERDKAASLGQVLPENFAENDVLHDAVPLVIETGQRLTVYRARRGGRVGAVIFEVVAHGYAGPITLVMGVDRAGTVLGVRVVRHAETPGLGDKIEAAKSDWIHAFEGKTLERPALAQWGVRKDGGEFDQFAGATITPRGVVAGVKQGLQLFAARKAEMLGETSVADAGASR